jgi:predicted DNA-binding transcriptional regulator AlpA
MTGQVQAAVLSKKEAAKLCGISTATLDRLRKAGDFVKPIQLATQVIGFKRTEVDAWIATRPILLHYAGTEEL